MASATCTVSCATRASAPYRQEGTRAFTDQLVQTASMIVLAVSQAFIAHQKAAASMWMALRHLPAPASDRKVLKRRFTRCWKFSPTRIYCCRPGAWPLPFLPFALLVLVNARLQRLERIGLPHVRRWSLAAGSHGCCHVPDDVSARAITKISKSCHFL